MQHQSVHRTMIKREQGENPRQSRCCNLFLRSKQKATVFYREGVYFDNNKSEDLPLNNLSQLPRGRLVDKPFADEKINGIYFCVLPLYVELCTVCTKRYN